jgi:hypothetical protein
MDQDNFDEHNLGDLRQDIHKLLDLIDSREIFKNLDLLKSTLLKLETRIDYCGHCNGATYDNGVCVDHFTE